MVTLYGYFRSDCIWESAAALVSLHRTKAGAYRAMRAQLWAKAIDERDYAIANGRWLMKRKTLQNELYYVSAVQVLD